MTIKLEIPYDHRWLTNEHNITKDKNTKEIFWIVRSLKRFGATSFPSYHKEYYIPAKYIPPRLEWIKNA